ncbi:hypothetical protein OUZ56_032778 [Daphnia magna]|uniref:Uncharacterized protein n=1 Tax=Daphnia magna TaxID=35525 RepID=A0ABQ9ZX52_9CRUS|nr:hypothetical protein OUZ56_032778 [Daphnia magna]
MVNNYLLKIAVRDKVVRIEKVCQVFPPDVRDFLHESLQIPFSSSKLSISIKEGEIKLLGSPKLKKLNLEEEVALMNYLQIYPEDIDRKWVWTQNYVPASIESTTFSFLPGQTMKLIGLGPSLIAIDPSEIVTKRGSNIYKYIEEKTQ